MSSIVKKRLILCIGGYVLLALVTLCAFIGNLISIMQLGIVYSGLFIVAVLIVTNILSGSRKRVSIATDTVTKSLDHFEQKAALRTIRNYKVAVIIMLLILIYGLYDSREFPLWVTLVGVAINVGITYILVLVVRSKNAKLDQ